MKHKINTFDKEGNTLNIEIRLDDECHNGHADFAITATGWEKGKPKTDRYMMYGGCCHEAILKARPDLKPFVDLHLSTAQGVPMYAVENGFYFLKEGSNGKPPKEVTMDYLRINEQEFEFLKQSEDKIYFQCLLEKLRIPERWKQEADRAIKILEEMTGQKFVDTSTKKGFIPLGEKMAEIEARIKEGFYSPEKIQERENQKIEDRKIKTIEKITQERDGDVKKANDEFSVQMAVINGGCFQYLDNFIYYNHTNEGHFNWYTSSYNKAISQSEFEAFLKTVDYSTLPKGIVFKISPKDKK